MPTNTVNSPFVRRAFTRFRFGGVAAQTIPRAWLRILGPIGGAPQILDPVEGENQTLAAFIRIQNVFAVRVADVLKDNASGRLFIVRQVQPEPGRTDLLHCIEIQSPIPDEFNAQSVEAFWSQTAAGFSVSSDGSTEAVLLLDSMPAGTLPSVAKGNYQLVSGDFDVFVRVRTDAGSVGNVRHALLGARHPSSNLGCYVGVRDSGTTGDLVRLDEYQASTLDTTVGVGSTSATLRYVRLKRTGSRFQVFYSTLVGVPASDADWIEIVNDPATSFSSVDDLRVGLWGYTNNSTAGQALWALLRNWTQRSAIAQGLQPFDPDLAAIAQLSGDGFLRKLAGEWLMAVIAQADVTGLIAALADKLSKTDTALQAIISDLRINKAGASLLLGQSGSDVRISKTTTDWTFNVDPISFEAFRISLANAVATFNQIPLLPAGLDPTLVNQAARKGYVDSRQTRWSANFYIADVAARGIDNNFNNIQGAWIPGSNFTATHVSVKVTAGGNTGAFIIVFRKQPFGSLAQTDLVGVNWNPGLGSVIGVGQEVAISGTHTFTANDFVYPVITAVSASDQKSVWASVRGFQTPQ